MKKKILTLVAVATMMVLMPAAGLFGQDTGGTLSPDVSWRIENNTLYFSGKGFVPTTMFRAKSAWDKSRSLFNAVVVEEGITLVGKNVFAGYSNITSLTVAGSVKELSPESFSKCSKLTKVEMKGDIPPSLNHTTFLDLNFKNAKLIVPAGTKSTYADDPLWGQFGTIEESAQAAQATPVETLAQPCTVNLIRKGGAVAVKFPVFLNGKEEDKLGAGKTLTMKTDRSQNMIYIKQGNTPLSVCRFVATAGGEVNIKVVYIMKTNVYMFIADGDHGDEEDE